MIGCSGLSYSEKLQLLEGSAKFGLQGFFGMEIPFFNGDTLFEAGKGFKMADFQNGRPLMTDFFY